MNDGKYKEAIAAFEAMNGYRDSAEQIELCNTAIKDIKYNNAVALEENGKLPEAAIAFGKINDYKHARARSFSLWDKIAVRDVVSAGSLFTVSLKANGTVVAVGNNGNGQCDVSSWTDIVAVSAGNFHTVGLKANGTVVAVGNNDDGQCNVDSWTDIVAVSAGGNHTVGLKADGTVVAVGDNEDGQCDVSGWKNIKVPER